ncbi:MAG TPA: PAS domain S-box protein [Candidatus Binataceae bacterium]|nr:PAS domain S-box protein [Candidatus Binataceae bacterium]
MSHLEGDYGGALLAAIVEYSNDAIISTTLEGAITSWNRAAEKLFGYSAAEAIGQHITLIIPSERHAEEDGILARLRRGEKIDNFETVRQAKDGRKLEISLTVSPIKDAQGQTVGASKMVRDVTERKLAYEDRERLAAIIDSSDDAIISKTLEGIITSWNRGAEKLFGYGAAEAIGQHITLIIPSERHAEEEGILARLRRGEKIDHFETVRQAKDGRTLHISLTVSPIRDAQGQTVGASKVARDITEQKRMEEQRARVAGIERAALRTAQEASQLKDDFLATVSHELRNPLNSIVGWAGLLRSGKLDEKTTARAIESIFRASQAQDRIIGDLLDISRVVSGRMRLDVRPLQLIKVLEEAVDTIRPAADAKQIRLHCLLDPAASPMAGDPDRLRQVFWNLLSNAVKFTPKGGRVQILSQRINSHVEITVSDTGAGIDPELLPKVFERFRQGETGTNRQSSGLGLGLAIVRSLVELHGGTVQAESKGNGQGASFIVRLPTLIALSPIDEEGRTHPVLDEALRVQKVPSLSNLRVLIVDDEVGARELVSTILVQAQAEVRAAGSASEALKVLDEWQPDVLVADIGMPEVDGYEFIRKVRLRGAQSGGAVPAAALTAYARTQDRLRVLSEGYQMHIPKPIQPAELVTVVASLAKRLT